VAVSLKMKKRRENEEVVRSEMFFPCVCIRLGSYPRGSEKMHALYSNHFGNHLGDI